MATTDCMSFAPKPEPIVHHATRLLHNLFHPRHKQHYVPLINAPQLCVAPELETVTVMSPEPALPRFEDEYGTWVDASGCYHYSTDWPVDDYWGYVAPGPTSVGVPEPGLLLLFATAIAAVWFGSRKVYHGV